MRCCICNHLLEPWEELDLCDNCLDVIDDTLDSYDEDDEQSLWDQLMEELEEEEASEDVPEWDTDTDMDEIVLDKPDVFLYK